MDPNAPNNQMQSQMNSSAPGMPNLNPYQQNNSNPAPYPPINSSNPYQNMPNPNSAYGQYPSPPGNMPPPYPPYPPPFGMNFGGFPNQPFQPPPFPPPQNNFVPFQDDSRNNFRNRDQDRNDRNNRDRKNNRGDFDDRGGRNRREDDDFRGNRDRYRGYESRDRFDSRDDSFGDRRRGGARGRGGRGGRRDEDFRSKQHYEVLEQTHTLFFRSIGYDTNPTTFKTLVESIGKVANFSPIIEKRGICFVTYDDVRDADKALKELDGYVLDGRPLRAIYAIEPNHQNGFLYTSTFKVTPNVTPCHVSQDEIYQTFSQFGEIREFTRNSDGQSYTVKFFTLSSARKAHAAQVTIANVNFLVDPVSPKSQEVGNDGTVLRRPLDNTNDDSNQTNNNNNFYDQNSQSNQISPQMGQLAQVNQPPPGLLPFQNYNQQTANQNSNSQQNNANPPPNPSQQSNFSAYSGYTSPPPPAASQNTPPPPNMYQNPYNQQFPPPPPPSSAYINNQPPQQLPGPPLNQQSPPAPQNSTNSIAVPNPFQQGIPPQQQQGQQQQQQQQQQGYPASQYGGF